MSMGAPYEFTQNMDNFEYTRAREFTYILHSYLYIIIYII